MATYSLKQFGERLRKIRKALKLSQGEFGAALNLSGSFISDIEKGRSKAGLDLFFYISSVYKVNLYYLVLGTGEMFGTDGVVPSLGTKEVGQSIENGAELLWYIENSPYFRFSVLGFATKFLYDNEAFIKKDLGIPDKTKENEHD
jgi:transcriptional regulator with XRE-family HTH domain